MGIIETCIKRPVTTVMIFLAIIVIGFVSFTNLKVDLFPSINIPICVVYTTYNGAGPQEMESLVTKPLESALSTVSDLKQISSTSSMGSSVIIIQFNNNTDMDFASLNVREKVDLVKAALPTDASTPMVLKLDPNQFPIIQLGITSKSKDLVTLNNYVEKNIQNRLERINGVASADVSGGKTEEILITLLPENMKGYGITTDLVRQTLVLENLNLPAGKLMQGESNIVIRTIGEFSSVDEIKNIPIQSAGGIVYLRDIALVERKYKEMTSFSYINGEPSIMVQIQKQSVANTVDVAKKLHTEIQNIIDENQGDLEITYIMDSSTYITSSISNVTTAAYQGGLLAVIILYIFLRNVGSTFIIATSIPVSIIATFILMYFNKMSFNMISLGALVIGIGMLVDNSIVVIENIYRHREMGTDIKKASLLGAKEVSLAITASTLTSVAVFLPLIFTTGMVATIFHELAWVLTYSLGVSLLVAITLVPMLSSVIMKDKDAEKEFKRKEKYKDKKGIRFLNKIFDQFDKWIKKAEDMYQFLLDKAIQNRKKTLFIVGAFCLIGLFMIIIMKKELYPVTDEGTYTVNIELPNGKVLEETMRATAQVEDAIKGHRGIQNMYVSIGSGSILSGTQSNRASITVDIGSVEERRFSIEQSMEEIRGLVKDIPGCKITVEAQSQSGMGSSTEPVNIEVTGDDLDTLQKVAEDVVNIISEIDGIREAKRTSERGDLEAKIIIDRTRLSQYALSTQQVARAIQIAIQGTVATKYKVDGKEIDITVKNDDTSVKYIKDISNIYVDTPLGVSIPLTEVGRLEINYAPSSITRINQNRLITVSAKLVGIDLGKAQTKIDEALSSYSFPEGYRYSWAGDAMDMAETFSSLVLALMLAVLLIYMVLASQFESLLNPFIIMMAVPLALIGSIYGLFFTGTSLSAISIMGFIILSGIVVNNAIVLIDFIIQERERGTALEEAVKLAAKVRLKPILMTTLTTVLGMLPMALGLSEGMENDKPMAIVIIFGLSISTLLTLVIIPILYIMFENVRERRRHKRQRA